MLELSSKSSADPYNLRTVTTFSNLANTNPPLLAPLKKCLGLWNSSWMHNDMRNFLYLLRNNGLMLNNRLNAFDRTVSPNCTFCRIVDREAAPRDGFLHFFYDCPVTFRLMSQLCNIFELPLNRPEFQEYLLARLYSRGAGGINPTNFRCRHFQIRPMEVHKAEKNSQFPSFPG